MKKSVALVALFAAVALTACGKKQEAAPAAAPAASAPAADASAAAPAASGAVAAPAASAASK